ncbi:MAG: hypothetical protein LBF22_10500, partial [Deltaproteobacteria bacterium]|nr:hypothetical protein [Deltaproteobacteria bacterium]
LALALGNLGKPGETGAKLIAIFKTTGGIAREVLINTLCPELIWAFSSTTEDVFVRSALYERFGVEKTLKYLANHWKGGVKREVERLKTLVNDDALEGEKNEGVVKNLISEIIRNMELS